MAAAAPRSARRGSDGLELPCAAPPAPLPQPPRLAVPEPETLLLTPERGGGGILRRRQPPAKVPGRQVRFKLASRTEDAPDPARQEAEGRPHVAAALKTEPGGGAAAGPGSQLPPSPLGTPAPHSTLALGVEAQALREQGFDARQAAEELVQRSFVARCAVEARVGEGLNIPRDQQLYQDLVSLQVPAEELLSSAVQERLALVRPHQEARKQEPDCTGPDLLAFYNPQELFTETPFLEVEGLAPLKLRPRPRDLAHTFLMYRNLRQWDG
ncbi:hypothetical protein lerEdw1_006340 [Lerista edwardsae]|nr:hypothetical protein lerEdw1_006340 [Lerista edwardsae]